MTDSIPMPASRGFTIIELLVTIVLVGILACAAIPMVELEIQRSRERDLREALRTIRIAIDAYKQASIEGRVRRNADESGYPRSLDELMGVPDQKDPKGSSIRFLRQIPRDPMNQDSSLDPSQTWGLRSYASSHSNPQIGQDVFDVYSMARGKGINGIPYKEW